MSREVGDGIAVKLNGNENVILIFRPKAELIEGETAPEPFLWGFQTRNEFGLFVASLQAFFNEVTR